MQYNRNYLNGANATGEAIDWVGKRMKILFWAVFGIAVLTIIAKIMRKA